MANTDTSNNTIEQLQQRIDGLESRLAFQDDVIDQLNHEVSVHQELLSELGHQIKMLATRMKDMRTSNIGKLEDEPPPPHY